MTSESIDTASVKDTAPVLASVRNHTGVLELNRPKALNSLNPDMVHIIAKALEDWREDDSVEQVLVYSNSPKGFCAGGDVRFAREGILDGRTDEIDQFFADEYRMNAAISNYPKPYIAVIDGVAMGGGLGISAHGSHRVVTEKAFAAMPEMAIGYVTDVGVPYMSQRMVGTRAVASPALAKFWGITGYRMYAADMLWSGLATHVVDDASAVVEDIIADGVDAALARHARDKEQAAPLEELIESIEVVFAHQEWAEIQAALQSSQHRLLGDATAELLSAASPTSVVAAAELYRAEEEAESIEKALASEESLGRYLRSLPDFAEGVRAVLVDKSKDAAFSPENVEDVDIEALRAHL